MHCTIIALESGLRRADFRGLCYELSDQDRADCCLLKYSSLRLVSASEDFAALLQGGQSWEKQFWSAFLEQSFVLQVFCIAGLTGAVLDSDSQTGGWDQGNIHYR